MIPWDKISDEDLKLVLKVVDRAWNHPEMNVRRTYGDAKQTLQMDLEATHLCGCTLDFERLLKFDDFNFFHDIYGIHDHLNRETGELENFFIPRCKKEVGMDFVRVKSKEVKKKEFTTWNFECEYKGMYVRGKVIKISEMIPMGLGERTSYKFKPTETKIEFDTRVRTLFEIKRTLETPAEFLKLKNYILDQTLFGVN